MRRTHPLALLLLLLAMPLAGTACEEDSGGLDTNPCGLTPSGSITDGHLTGGMQFAGVAVDFPLSVDLNAAARTFTGSLQFQDAVQSYNGTLQGTISEAGALTGSYRATGARDGRVIEGTVSGFTDNAKACGAWDNTAGQAGSWQVTR